jgi:hypothetical protein
MSTEVRLVMIFPRLKWMTGSELVIGGAARERQSNLAVTASQLETRSDTSGFSSAKSDTHEGRNPARTLAGRDYTRRLFWFCDSLKVIDKLYISIAYWNNSNAF